MDALGRQQRHQDQDGREHQPPVVEQRAELVLEHDEQDGAPHRAHEVVHAAQHHHQERIGRVLPAQRVGVHAAHEEREHAARQPGDGRRQHEARELHPVDVVAQAGHALLVVADRLEQPPERRMHQAPHQPQRGQHHEHHEHVKAQC
jgi:hypothetical protein